MIPLSPYILLSNAVHGLAYSAVVTLAALGNLRISERTLHRNRAGAQCDTNDGNRWRGRSRGFRIGQTYFVRAVDVARAPSPAQQRRARTTVLHRFVA